MQNQEKKLEGEIRLMAKKGQIDSTKVLAASVIRNRRAIQKFYQLKSYMQAISLQLVSAKSIDSMQRSMVGAERAMAAMNKQMNIPALRKTMQEFSKQTEKTNTSTEMMEDALDQVFEMDGDAEATDEMVQQYLDEVGISAQMALKNAPTSSAVAEAPVAVAEPVGAGGGGGGGDARGGELRARSQKRR